jgi:flagellar biosynthesis protein FlhA
LLEVLSKSAPKLVDDVVPNLLQLGEVVRVLRNLLAERVSVRDLRTILEALADASSQTKDPEQLTELVRERLGAHITARLTGPDRSVAVLALDPRIEDVLRRSLREIAAGTGGAIDPELIRQLTASAERAVPKFGALGVSPAMVTPPDIRRFVRAIFERKLPQLNVVSFREIDASVPIRVVETLSMSAPGAGLPQTNPRSS